MHLKRTTQECLSLSSLTQPTMSWFPLRCSHLTVSETTWCSEPHTGLQVQFHQLRLDETIISLCLEHIRRSPASGSLHLPSPADMVHSLTLFWSPCSSTIFSELPSLTTLCDVTLSSQHSSSTLRCLIFPHSSSATLDTTVYLFVVSLPCHSTRM